VPFLLQGALDETGHLVVVFDDEYAHQPPALVLVSVCIGEGRRRPPASAMAAD